MNVVLFFQLKEIKIIKFYSFVLMFLCLKNNR